MALFVQNHPTAAEEVINLLNADGQRFDVRAFPAERRSHMHGILRQAGTVVTAADIRASIDMHMCNMAIREEIRTARETYANTHKFLTDFNAAG